MESKINCFFKSLGYRALDVDLCILVKQIKNGIIFVGIYVNDLLLVAKNKKLLN